MFSSKRGLSSGSCCGGDKFCIVIFQEFTRHQTNAATLPQFLFIFPRNERNKCTSQWAANDLSMSTTSYRQRPAGRPPAKRFELCKILKKFLYAVAGPQSRVELLGLIMHSSSSISSSRCLSGSKAVQKSCSWREFANYVQHWNRKAMLPRRVRPGLSQHFPSLALILVGV